MSKYKLTISTSQQEFSDLKSDIEKLISCGEDYVVNFYENKKRVKNTDDIIIIDSEYEITYELLSPIMKSNSNLKYGAYDIERLVHIKRIIISHV